MYVECEICYKPAELSGKGVKVSLNSHKYRVKA